MPNKKKKVGDTVIVFIRRPNGSKVKLVGKIKEITDVGGGTYTITEAIAEDFNVRRLIRRS